MAGQRHTLPTYTPRVGIEPISHRVYKVDTMLLRHDGPQYFNYCLSVLILILLLQLVSKIVLVFILMEEFEGKVEEQR